MEHGSFIDVCIYIYICIHIIYNYMYVYIYIYDLPLNKWPIFDTYAELWVFGMILATFFRRQFLILRDFGQR